MPLPEPKKSTLAEWLAREVDVQRVEKSGLVVNGQEKLKVTKFTVATGARLTQLFAFNGGNFDVVAIGMCKPAKPFGRIGFATVQEALEFSELKGIALGLIMAGGGTMPELEAYMHAEVARVKALNEEKA